MTITTIRSLVELLTVEISEINVPRTLTPSQCADLLNAGLIAETGIDDARPDQRYESTDYARDLIWGRLGNE